MSRRDFRTPASLPLETTGRCIVVPNDAAWLGLLNAALLMLTEQWRYDQVETTDLTPEETAAIWYDIYVSTLTSACDDCPDMNCNDVLACMLPYLESSFYEDADIRIDPITSKPQVSYDGGTTWSDIPQSGDGTINAPQPTPTAGANDDAKICLAATRAALVIAEFYKQTFGAFTADVMNALGTANTFLQDVKMILFNAIYSPYDGILEAAGFLTQDFETNYTAGELSAQNLEDLLCLLVNNAAVDSSGVITFDYGAVRDNVIADVGINPGTALWFLLGNMQEAGLNASGSVRITDTPLDCLPCLPDWTADIDFSEGAQGWFANGGNSTFDGTKFVDGCAYQASTSTWYNTARAAFTSEIPFTVTRVEFVIDQDRTCWNADGNSIYLVLDDQVVAQANSASLQNATDASVVWSGSPVLIDMINTRFGAVRTGNPESNCHNCGYTYVKRVIINGNGYNPFGV